MRPRTDINWRAVDWSQHSKTIAKQLGCAPSTVLRYRKIHAPGIRVAIWHKYDWSKVTDWNQRTDVLARTVGCSESVLRAYRHEKGIKLGPRKPGSGLWKQKSSLANR